MATFESSFGPAFFSFVVGGVLISAVVYFIDSRKLAPSRKRARLFGIFGIVLAIMYAAGAFYFEARTGMLSKSAATVTSDDVFIWGVAAVMICILAIFAKVLANRKKK